MIQKNGHEIAEKTLNNFIAVCCKHGFIDPRKNTLKNTISDLYYKFKRTLIIPGEEVDKAYRVDIKVPCNPPHGGLDINLGFHDNSSDIDLEFSSGSLDIDVKSLKRSKSKGCVLEILNNNGDPGWLFSSACSHIAFSYETEYNFILVHTEDLRELIRNNSTTSEDIRNGILHSRDEFRFDFRIPVIKYRIFNRPDIGKGKDAYVYADWDDILNLPSSRIWNMDVMEKL